MQWGILHGCHYNSEFKTPLSLISRQNVIGLTMACDVTAADLWVGRKLDDA